MNEVDKVQLVDLIDGASITSATVVDWLRAVQKTLQIIGLENLPEAAAYMASANIRACLRHAETQQNLLEQLLVKAEGMLESETWGTDNAEHKCD
jgi:hypothetical protein